MFCFILRHVRECDKLHAFLLYCFKFFFFVMFIVTGSQKQLFTVALNEKFFVPRNFGLHMCVCECVFVSVIGFKECENICFETHLRFSRITVCVYVYVFVCLNFSRQHLVRFCPSLNCFILCCPFFILRSLVGNLVALLYCLSHFTI